jgi:protein involved in polysaccharide export with SLBB domain
MDYHQTMNRIILFHLLAIITMTMSGCAAYHNEAMAGADVGKKQMAPVLTEPTLAPASNTHNRENIAPVSATAKMEDTIIQVGDVLEVAVAEDHSFNGYYEVRLGGYFILPAVGRIEAAGLPIKEIEAKLSKALEDTQLAHATVKVEKLVETYSGRQR